jgi:chorismate-pyruvate lyase
VNRSLPDMFANTLAGPRGGQAIPAWAALLERFYDRTGLSLPALRELKAEEVPPPYQGLLVHSSDMTPTLTGFYGQALRLRVLGRERREDSYRREVILWLAEDARPVEYGVIRIYLGRLPPEARRLVLEEQRPLGDILQQEAVPHLSWPKGYFRIRSDAHAGTALGLRRPSFLYGRRNVLLDGSRHLLAEVIEVLAPVTSVPREANGRESAGRGSPAGGDLIDVNHLSLRRMGMVKTRT